MCVNSQIKPIRSENKVLINPDNRDYEPTDALHEPHNEITEQQTRHDTQTLENRLTVSDTHIHACNLGLSELESRFNI